MAEAGAPDGRFRRLSDRAAVLGESPVWSASGKCIWWIDVADHRLFRTDAGSGRTEAWRTPELIGFVTLNASGRPLVGMESGLFAFDPLTGAFDKRLDLPDPSVRFNDATTDAAGRLWAVTMDIGNAADSGMLCRIDPDYRMSVLATGFRTANGLAVDAARGRLFVSDSHSEIRRIWYLPLDVATGITGDRQLFADLGSLAGRPDGAQVDEAGTYWIAGVDGAALYGFREDGGLVAELPLPVQYPTKPAFGAGGEVYLTSKTGGGADGGYLMVGRPGLKGPVAPPFGGR